MEQGKEQGEKQGAPRSERGQLLMEKGIATQFRPGVSGNPRGRPPLKRIRAAMDLFFEENPLVLEAMIKAWVGRSRVSSGHARLIKEIIDGREPFKVQGDDGLDSQSSVELRISVVPTPQLPAIASPQIIDLEPEEESQPNEAAPAEAGGE